MPLDALQSHLRDAFHPPAAGHLDAVFRLTIGEESLAFRVADGALSFDLPGAGRADATFMFDDAATAWALLTGQGDAFEAFMDGRFRSDGHLMWAFALMAMFRAASLPVNPTE